MRRSRNPTGRRLLVGAAAVLAAATLLPPVQARGKALAVLVEALGYELPRPFASHVIRQRVELRGVAGDMYLPIGKAPAIVLVPGAAPDGPDDARVVRLATALARAGRVVFVPVMRLADKQFTQDDIDALVTSVIALDEYETTGLPVLLGFSYGGSFSLVAAADPRLDDRLRLVATFGAYYDLVGVAQAVTTGTSVVGRRHVPWDAHPRAEEIFNEVIVNLAPAGDRHSLEEALSGSREPRTLSKEARTVYEFATNSDPSRTYDLARELPDEMQQLLDRFSPSSVVGAIEAPVIALHSRDDPAVPYGEAIRLERALPAVRLVTVSLFRHVDLDRAWHRALPDMWRTWRFASWLLAAQE